MILYNLKITPQVTHYCFIVQINICFFVLFKQAGALLHRLVGHRELQLAATDDVRVVDEGAGQGVAIQADLLDVLVGRAVVVDDHLERSTGHLQGRLVDHRPSDRVGRDAGADLVEAEGAHDVPRRHLAAILVADDAVGRVGIELAHDEVEPLLRLPGRVGPVIRAALAPSRASRSSYRGRPCDGSARCRGRIGRSTR